MLFRSALAQAGTVGVLLPAAALTLRLSLPEAAMLRRSDARVAIATDFNPGTAPAQSLMECAALAGRLCGFDANELLMAITWNAARALGAEAEVGHLTPGAWGDAVQWECETLEELPYWMPSVRPDTVFMRGADLALVCAGAHGVRLAVLKDGSPSCGSSRIADGTFSGASCVQLRGRKFSTPTSRYAMASMFCTV